MILKKDARNRGGKQWAVLIETGRCIMVYRCGNRMSCIIINKEPYLYRLFFFLVRLYSYEILPWLVSEGMNARRRNDGRVRYWTTCVCKTRLDSSVMNKKCTGSGTRTQQMVAANWCFGTAVPKLPISWIRGRGSQWKGVCAPCVLGALKSTNENNGWKKSSHLLV